MKAVEAARKTKASAIEIEKGTNALEQVVVDLVKIIQHPDASINIPKLKEAIELAKAAGADKSDKRLADAEKKLSALLKAKTKDKDHAKESLQA